MPKDDAERLANDLAVSWSATVGLVPGYGHDNRPNDIEALRAKLLASWTRAMGETLAETGHYPSCVATNAVVLYQEDHGCPPGGEQAMLLVGSSNPRDVPPHDFAAFEAAVERTVRQVQREMEQRTVRIEFSRITRSVYSRL